MSAQRSSIDALRDILDAAEKAQRFTAGMDLPAFRADDQTVFAVTRALEIIGEATKQVPLAVRQRYPHVPWQAMAGMRDKLIHHYPRVNVVLLWKTVQEDLPALIAAMTAILPDVEEEEPS